MKRTIAIIVAVFALAVSAQAQASLTASSSIPVADGTMGASEYHSIRTYPG